MTNFQKVSGSYSSLQSQLKMARDALIAQQTAMNTVSHNVANVNTPGYHRQRVMFETRASVGSGMDVQSIQRAYHTFLTRQERTDAGEAGRWQMQSDLLARVEAMMNELGDSGVTTSLDEFFNAWQDLANDVDSTTSRVNLIGKARDLVFALHNTYARLDDIRTEVNAHMMSSVGKINDLATQVAQLNEQIYTVVSRRQQPNDLMDRRDQLIKELASVANITIQEENNGSVTVFLGNEALVSMNTARMVEWSVDRSGSLGKSGGDIVWADNGNTLQLKSGELYGDVTTRELIGNTLTRLDTFADALRDEVNALHTQGIARDGSTGNRFFDVNGGGALMLELSADLLANPQKVAASRYYATGDAGLAHEIFNLQFAGVLNNGQTSLTDFYQGIVTDIGIEAGRARTFAEASKASLQQAENWQQSYTGVNLDEEMADMITIQYAFTAASKVANLIDEMMSLISKGFA